MDPLNIILIALALVGVWAIAELAITLRRTRKTVDSLDRTVEGITETLAEAKPVIEKLDTTLDEIQPALAQVEPLLKKGNIAVEALSADLIEINGVIRDVSDVTGNVSSASGAVTGIASAASEKVQRLFSKKRDEAPAGDRTLTETTEEPGGDASEPAVDEAVDEPHPRSGQRYYTYSDSSADDGDTPTTQEASDE